MDYQLYGKNLTITDSLKIYLDRKLGRLWKVYDRITSCHVDLSRDAHHHRGNVFRAEINLKIPVALLRSVEFHNDIRAAIDLGIDSLLNQLKKRIIKKRDQQRCDTYH